MTNETVFSTNQVKRVLIVDDHPLVRTGLNQMISDEPDLEVCGEAAGVTEAMARIEDTKPDLAIIDISLKEGSGLGLIKKIKTRDDPVKMLVLSMHDETMFAERALHAGAMGYVEKHEASTRIIEAIREVLSGQIYLSKGMMNRLLSGLAGSHLKFDKSPLKHLTNREFEVFELIGEGITTSQIAARLHLSVKTIETHREKIKKKLNLSRSNELIRYAMQWVLEDN